MKYLKYFEGKQVGILYHYTSLKNLIKIIKSNNLINGRNTNGDYIGICFSRNKFFHIPNEYSAPSNTSLECRLVINGDKLSNDYKINPVNDALLDSDEEKKCRNISTESEERIKDESIIDIKKYIISVDIFKTAFYPEEGNIKRIRLNNNIIDILINNNIDYNIKYGIIYICCR